MPIKINVKKSINDAAIKNYVLFSNEDFKINSLNKLSISRFSSNIGKTIDSNKSKKKEMLIFNLNPTQKIILVKLKNNMSPLSNEKKGAEFLKKVGLNKNSWFVTLHVREDNNKNTSENFRNSNPFNYIKAIKKITSNGGFVFRMGDKNSSMFPKMENFYDYAHSDFKSETKSSDVSTPTFRDT